MQKIKREFDVIVVGGTPGGIAAAVAAARRGRSVALVERSYHVGGMSTSGLGKSDIERREIIGGVFSDFIRRVKQRYVNTLGADSEQFRYCRNGYYFEPSVAEGVFHDILRDAGDITLLLGHQLEGADVDRDRVRAIRVTDLQTGADHCLMAAVFIDATYEGDLYAAGGAAYRLGRESRQEFDEPHAGVIYFDYQNGVILPRSTGAGDDRLPAYTYRLCLTTDPDNGVALTEQPSGYQRETYLPYLEDLAEGRLSAPKVLNDGWGYYPEHFDTLLRALSVTDLSSGKVDANINPRPLAFPFPEENIGYIEGDWETRDRIAHRHRELTLGLLWFLQQDESVPARHQKMARQYNLPRDEFTDNDHFPWQLYIREGRRLEGLYTMTQHDVTQLPGSPETPEFDDTIAMGEFPIDSFPVRKRQPGDTQVLEGYLGMLAHITRPYKIPYRAMIPRQLEGIIVPVALSATHVAYSSIRMEPTWMALGHAAGVAADLSLKRNSDVRDVPIPELQQQLAKEGQVLRLPDEKTQARTRAKARLV
ncbi:MAG: FAD-dependent oxidoreductase [Pirellulaceae bacterium]